MGSFYWIMAGIIAVFTMFWQVSVSLAQLTKKVEDIQRTLNVMNPQREKVPQKEEDEPELELE